jgi:hypothetical protein
LTAHPTRLRQHLGALCRDRLNLKPRGRRFCGDLECGERTVAGHVHGATVAALNLFLEDGAARFESSYRGLIVLPHQA